MKALFTFSIVLLVLCGSSCKKESPTPFMEVTILEETDSTISIQVEGFNLEGNYRLGVIYAADIAPVQGVSPLVDGAAENNIFACTLTDLEQGQQYFVKPFYTNEGGTTYDADNYECWASQKYQFGDIGPGGGYVYYLQGQYHGQEILAEPITTAKWDGDETAPTADHIGAGASNTAGLAAALGTGAAYEASQYVGGGYDDWFLPSSGEMFQAFAMLVQPEIIDLDEGYYWTSSKSSSNEYGITYKIDAGGHWDGDAYYQSKHTPMHYVLVAREF